jgi:hypothetical protein|eukprot:g3608.t1
MGQIFTYIPFNPVENSHQHITNYDPEVSQTFEALFASTTWDAVSNALISHCDSNPTSKLGFIDFCRVVLKLDMASNEHVLLARLFFNTVRHRPTSYSEVASHHCDVYTMYIVLLILYTDQEGSQLELTDRMERLFNLITRTTATDEEWGEGDSLSVHDAAASIGSFIRALSVLCYGQSDALNMPMDEVYSFCRTKLRENSAKRVSQEMFLQFHEDVPFNVKRIVDLDVGMSHSSDNCLACANMISKREPWRTLEQRFPRK